ncbi:MAG TPA: hypothetical protein VHO06_16670 [Polyangia bacterium]|nr:hypothetical protein [Polyangia bacterium]
MRWTLLSALFVVASCGQERMLPAASAHTVPGAPETASEEVGGVRVSADGDDWEARPSDLPDRLTPVKVRIINHSGAPAVIEYERFKLVGSHGRTYQALPLLPAEQATSLRRLGTIDPVYAASNFFVAPRYHGVYPTLSPWAQPLARDDSSFGERYRLWDDGLPTRSMERMGLPEGVLADGGEISGFLYFEDATKHESRLTFHADIDDVKTGDQLADIAIPFRVR